MRPGPPAGDRAGPRRRRRTLMVAVAASGAIIATALPRVAAAHGVPIQLEFWGPFGRATAACQHAIAAGASVCATRTWRARRDCLAREMAGEPCDRTALTAALESFRLAAVSHVQASCTAQQVVTLVFLDLFEAANDAVTFCRDLDTAAVSAVTLPVPADPASATAEVRACVASAANVTSSLLPRAFVSRRRLFDRLAQTGFSPPRKRAMVAASTAFIARTAAALERTLAKDCSPAAFVRTYGRSPATFLATMAGRADCLAGQVYAQAGVVCPAPECGNGMRENGERCDDGNVADGDGCSARCTLEAGAPALP